MQPSLAKQIKEDRTNKTTEPPPPISDSTHEHERVGDRIGTASRNDDRPTLCTTNNDDDKCGSGLGTNNNSNARSSHNDGTNSHQPEAAELACRNASLVVELEAAHEKRRDVIEGNSVLSFEVEFLKEKAHRLTEYLNDALSEISRKLVVCEEEVSHLTRSSEGRDQSVCSRILGSDTETSEGRLDELGYRKNIRDIMSQVARITGFIIEARGVIAYEREEQEHVGQQMKDCNMKIATLEKSLADAKHEACYQAQKAEAAQELYYKTKEELQHHQEKSESAVLEAMSCRDALRNELDRNTSAYNDLLSRFSLLEVENKNLKVDNKSLSMERDRVLTDHAKAHEQISSYEERMQKMSKEHHDALEMTKRKFVEKADRLSIENDSLHVELAEARTQLKRQEDDHTLVVQQKMDSIKKLESQLQETKEELQHHQEKSESDVLEAISCRDALRSELDQNTSAYNDLQSRFSLLEVENKNLKVDNKSLSMERDRVLTDHAKAHEQISSYEERMQKMSKEHHDALEMTKRKFVKKADRLSIASDLLHVELAEARTQLKCQKDDHTLVVQQKMDSIKKLESQLQETKEECSHYRDEHEAVVLSLDKESTLKNQVLEENRQLKESTTKCEQDLETKLVEARALMEKIVTLEEGKSKLEGNVAKLTDKIEIVNGKLYAIKDECKERADQVISLHDLLELSRKESANAKQLLEISESEGKVREQELGAAISALKNERSALQQKLQESNEQARLSFESYERTRSKLLESESRFELQLESLSAENTSLQTALRFTQLRLDAAQEDFQKMAKELDETESSMNAPSTMAPPSATDNEQAEAEGEHIEARIDQADDSQPVGGVRRSRRLEGRVVSYRD